MTGPDSPLLSGWEEALAAEERAEPEAVRVPLLPVCPAGLAAGVHLVDDAAKAEALLRALDALDLCAIALDCSFACARPPVRLRSGRLRYDVRALRPVAVALAVWANDGGAAPPAARYVLDVRHPGVVAALGRVLATRTALVFHDAKASLFACWALGLDPRPYHLYDTWVAAACLDLGRLHLRAEDAGGGDEPAAIAAAEAVRDRRTRRLSLAGQAERYGLAPPLGDEDAMRERLLALPTDRPLGAAEAELVAGRAGLALRVYAAQAPEVLRQGLARHLHAVEFPFVPANARMEWRGVRVDPAARVRAAAGARAAADALAARLRALGLADPSSAGAFLALVDRLGLGRHFPRRTATGLRATDDRALAAAEGLHPAVRCFRLHRKYRRLAEEEWLTGALEGADGRTHPAHVQVGASTGRNICSAPNLAGLPRDLRLVVVAPPGRALVELDFAQMEVGVAAAEHGDTALIAAFNSGDLYSAVAQRVCAAQLTPEERALAPAAFKVARPDLREQMKVFCLAVLYGMGPQAIAALLSAAGAPVTEAEAARQRDAFLALFPAVRAGLAADAACGLLRGHARLVSGLRRHRPEGRVSRAWLANALRNAPVQGGAAVAFKLAVVALDAAFAGMDTWLVLPLHDAVLIECPAAEAEAVAAEAAAIMARELRALYPALRPRVEANLADPRCWNKGGRSGSVEQLLREPLRALDLGGGEVLSGEK